MDDRAVVVGGGIGGLAAAIGLHRAGWRVTVLERAPVLADVGAGISLAANGVRALEALGLGPALRAAGRPQYTGGTRTPDGRRLARMDGRVLERKLGTPLVGISRARLHRLLRAALPDGALVTGAEVTGTGPADGRRVRVHATDTVREADLVVAADGVGSRLRARLFPAHPGPVRTGATVLRALTHRPVGTDEDFTLTWGRGTEFGHLSLADGRAEWHAVLPASAGAPPGDALETAREEFAGWHRPVPELLAATRPGEVLRHDVQEPATPLPRYFGGRTVLLGDAAHAMAPHLGQGACQGLEDAVTLAAALASGVGTDAALVRYDAERRPRSQSVAAAARRAGRLGPQLSAPLAVAARNAALRLAPDRITVRAMLRHADWTPPAPD